MRGSSFHSDNPLTLLNNVKWLNTYVTLYDKSPLFVKIVWTFILFLDKIIPGSRNLMDMRKGFG